jgi:hypothetical protein
MNALGPFHISLNYLASNRVSGALQAGPRLVTDGNMTLDPAGEGHQDPKILVSGKYITKPGRDISNALLIIKK